MSSSSSAAAESMVVVVDVVDAADLTVDTNASLERLEIDVDVTPHTTADDLLADVEAALAEMQCTLCVPRRAAGLAAGHVLPPLTALELAMRSAAADAARNEDKNSSKVVGDSRKAFVSGAQSEGAALTARYVAALRYVRGARGLTRDKMRCGSDRVYQNPSNQRPFSLNKNTEPPPQQPLVWSVVPQSLGQPSESLVAVSASTAATSAASSRMLARDDTTSPSKPVASTNAGVETRRETDEPRSSISGRDDRVPNSLGRAPLPFAEPSSRLHTPPLLPGSTGGSSKGTDTKSHHASHNDTQVMQPTHSVPPASAAVTEAVAAPVKSPAPPSSSAAHSPTSVVALEDVDVFSFRRLQAHRALVLAREEALHGPAAAAALLPGGVNATTSEEQQRLQPALPYVAVEAAIDTEVRRLQQEHVLMGGCASTLVDTERSGGTPCGSPTAALGAARARLRAAWLQTVREEVAAYQAETLELRQATEKAEVWRAALKDTLRKEIATLETAAAERSNVLAEREVLRSRVSQLEAQVAAAKAEELALLESTKRSVEASRTKEDANLTESAQEAASAAGVAAAAGASAEVRAASELRRSGSGQVAASLRNAAAQRRPLQSPSSPHSASAPSSSSAEAASASTSSSSSSSSASDSDSDAIPPPPPPPPAHAKAGSSHLAHPRTSALRDHAAPQSAPQPHHQRWSGRRVPLTHPVHVRQKQPRSRSRLSIERSFLPPSLQEEVRAALASDEEQEDEAYADDAGSSGSHRVSQSSEHNSDSNDNGVQDDHDDLPPPPPAPMQQDSTLSTTRRRRYQRKEDAEHAVGDAASFPTAAGRFPTTFNEAQQPRSAFAASVTPLRTAPTTAYSPSPVVPGMYWQEGRRYEEEQEQEQQQRPSNAGALRPQSTSSLSIPSPAFSNLYHDKQNQSSLVQMRWPETSSSPLPRPRAHASAVEELRSVTSALRRHIREVQPDPSEGQRLLQQVRELRREIERGGSDEDGEGDFAGEKREGVSQQNVSSAGNGHVNDSDLDINGRRGGNVTFADPQVPAGGGAVSAPVSRVASRQPYASSSLLYDSRVPSRRRGLYGY